MDDTYSIETVNTAEEARHQIETAREQGVDPWNLYRSHLAIAREMKAILDEEDR